MCCSKRFVLSCLLFIKNQSKKQLCLGLFFLLTLQTQVALAVEAKILVLNAAGSYPLSDDAQEGFLDVVISEALGRLGYGLESIRLPAERGLINSNAGIEDGEMMRITGLEAQYPNLIRVPESVIDMDFVVFSKNRTTKISGWQDLKKYSVAIITGWKILERNLSLQADLTSVRNEAQLFTLLLKNRVDLIIYSRWSGLGYLRRNNIRDVWPLSPPFARRKMYVYLHKKHKSLVLRLADSIREVKADGSYQRAFTHILGPFSEENIDAPSE